MAILKQDGTLSQPPELESLGLGPPEVVEAAEAAGWLDGTDATPELCRAYRDPRFRYARYEELTNQAGNFNRCLVEARGEFVTLLHSDDYFLPGFIGPGAEALGIKQPAARRVLA